MTDFKQKRWLVLGVTGFIGRHFRAKLQEESAEWIGTSRGAVPGDRLVPFDLEYGQLSDKLPKKWLQGSERLAVHAISLGGINQAAVDVERAVRLEVDAVQSLMLDLDRHGFRQVFLSSSCVFSGTQGMYREEDPCSPISQYGEHKRAIEQFLGEKIPTALVLRVDKVVGSSVQDEHLLSHWWRAMQRLEPVRCLKGHVFTPILAEDVVEAVRRLAAGDRSGIYHVAGPSPILRKNFAALLADAAGVTANIVEQTEEELGLLDRRPMNSSLDTAKFQHDTGFSPSTPEQIVDRFLSTR